MTKKLDGKIAVITGGRRSALRQPSVSSPRARTSLSPVAVRRSLTGRSPRLAPT